MKNIIFITLDCVRPDHLGCYGYNGVDTPNIDRLAQNGIIFDQAFCQGPVTWVSMASTFTGCYPFTHGLHRPHDVIRSEIPTIAEILSENGYHTIAFPAHNLVGKARQFDRGFNYFYEADFKFNSKIRDMKWCCDWDGIINQARDQISQNTDKPIFAWFHYINTHELPNEHLNLPEHYRNNFSDKWQYYDGKISYADKVCIEEIVNILKQNNIYDDSIIVIFSDHGEELKEGCKPTHDNLLFDDATRVTMIISNPDVNDKRISDLVGTIDLLPTILEMTGVDYDIQKFDGKSLVPFMDSEISTKDQWIYSENVGKNLIAIRTLQHKLVIEIKINKEQGVTTIVPIKLNMYDVDSVTFEMEIFKGQVPIDSLPGSVFNVIKALERSLNEKSSINESQEERINKTLKYLGYV